MAATAEPREQPRLDRQPAFEHIWSQPTGFVGLLRTVDNIPVARRYLATGFAFFILGGVLALLMRIQLGTPDNTFLDADTYNQIFTMHGTTMMFLFVIPFIEALANYLLPLILGTRDLPFPRLTALSYWTYLFGGLLLYSSFLFGLARDVDQPHSRLRLGDAGHRVHDHLRVHPADRGYRDARARSQGAHQLLRAGARRGPAALAAPLLGVRPPGGLHHVPAGRRDRDADRPGVLPATGGELHP